jgi:REP element-mobilizing transposase RayT
MKIKDRPPRLQQIFQTYDPPLFFVTICTIHRQKIRDLGTAYRAFEWYVRRARDEFGVAVGHYVIMPDHMHFFVRGGDDFKLAQWVNGLKRAISVALGATKRRRFGSRDFSITCCVTTRATAKNGNTCARTLCVPDWLYGPMNGRTKVNLW